MCKRVSVRNDEKAAILPNSKTIDSYGHTRIKFAYMWLKDI